MGRRQQRPRPPHSEASGDPWIPPAAADILLVSADPYLQDEAVRIVAASGGRLRTVERVEEALSGWDTADVLIVGSDVRETPPRRRAPAVLLGRSAEAEELWRLAAVLGAERVAALPEAAAWLAEHLSLASAPEPGGTMVGVVGGRGGSGATTAAIWLAHAAANHGVATLLVDGDPWGGGVELAVSDQSLPGLRWPDFAATRGSIDPGQFRDSLPTAGGFAFLSWPGTREPFESTDPASASAVLDAARRAFELTVIDIARNQEGLQAFAWDCDRILLLTTTHLKSAVATARVLNEVPPSDTGLLVRAAGSDPTDPHLVADALGIPLAGVVPDLRGVGAGTEQGRLLELGRRRPVRRFAEAALGLNGGDR